MGLCITSVDGGRPFLMGTQAPMLDTESFLGDDESVPVSYWLANITARWAQDDVFNQAILGRVPAGNGTQAWQCLLQRMAFWRSVRVTRVDA